MQLVAREMTDPEASLVAAAQRGDREAFERLIHAHARSAGRLAVRLLRSREDAEDAVQEAFVRAYTHLRAFRADASFKTWLLRIVLSVAHDHLRKAKRRAAAPPVVEPGGEPAAGAAPEARDRLDALRRAIDLLPPKQKAALLLKVYEGMSHAEVARAIGSTAGAARVYLALARQSLRRRFAAWIAARSPDGGER